MSSHRLVIKDAAWQLIGRVASALLGFLVIKIMSPYLWPLRYGDYSTILKYFAIWSALADFGLYVIAVRELGVVKELEEKWKAAVGSLNTLYSKFVGTRFVTMIIVYTTALVVAYFLPAYTSNPYLVRWLPLWMIFSASFMASWITQIPLQLFWKMEKLSFWLIFARVAQIALLVCVVYWWFADTQFTQVSTKAIIAFVMIMGSVVLSAITQRIYVERQANKLLKFRIIVDRAFIKKIYLGNRQYGVAYYLSSFHTLIVLILLSNFFPTAQWNIYTGIWALALSLIEILLIIPSSLGNSLLHKVASYNLTNKRKSFGNLLSLIYWIGGVAFINFLVFADPLIALIGGDNYLGTSLSNPGANQILPFLALVLWLSFIKQVFNYLFVAIERNNDILWVNLVWVIVGLSIWLYAIPQYALVGWIITQVILEIMYVLGAIYVGHYHRALPFVSPKRILLVSSILLVVWYIAWYFTVWIERNIWLFLAIGAILNIVILWTSYTSIKQFARWLTITE